ncbi:hypothetical protein [Methylobacterium sp. J-090]|uniref:hypothetical protein n=1 Tax=Methylobacterium sp. J-090 TaxID=2836666 RepID=UPI001FB91603|nr:hypothetical protein [Methylobacterium sp. J-090]MCJ2082539.1 hypothetical protein [Methylobacterium sp. J-090]
MSDPDPFAPRHLGSALSLTGLVALMTSEGTRPDILGLACGCLAAALVAFTVDLCHTPKRQRSRKGRRPGAPRAVAPTPVTARSALPHEPRVHPALAASVRGARTPGPEPVPPVAAVVHRRALKDVRNRRIARGT